MQPLQYFMPPGIADMLQGPTGQVLASVEFSQLYSTLGARPPGNEGGFDNQKQKSTKSLAFGT